MPRISSKHQVTLPVESLEAAGLRAAPDLASALGVFDGLYEPGHLGKLRSEERG